MKPWNDPLNHTWSETIEGPPSFWKKPKAVWLPAWQAPCKVLGPFCRLCVEAWSHLPCGTPCRASGLSFLAAVMCLPLKRKLGRVHMGSLAENRRKNSCATGKCRSNSAISCLTLTPSSCPGICHQESERAGFWAGIKTAIFMKNQGKPIQWSRHKLISLWEFNLLMGVLQSLP